MQLLVGFALIAYVFCSFTEQDYLNAVKETEDIFPRLIVGAPQILEVVFEDGASLDFGKTIIKPTETINPPLIIDWEADPELNYTLAVITPDAPTKHQSYYSPLVSWLVGNIPGKNVAKGTSLFAYTSAGPGENQGVQRYFYFIFEENGFRDLSKERRVGNETVFGRFQFLFEDYIEEHELIGPVAFNFFSSDFDEQSNNLYRQLDCCNELILNKNQQGQCLMIAK